MNSATAEPLRYVPREWHLSNQMLQVGRRHRQLLIMDRRVGSVGVHASF